MSLNGSAGSSSTSIHDNPRAKLRADDLLSLERYSKERSSFRPRVIAHKKRRTLQVGAHATFCFEDRLTVQYQVQEMLRIERIFEPDGIESELDAYNPLIPDGANLKATLLIEYDEVEMRKRELEKLRGIEDEIALRVGDSPQVLAIADEDLDRSNETKTSAVHFLRFELTPAMVASARAGARLAFSVDHPHYSAKVAVEGATRAALVADLD